MPSRLPYIQAYIYIHINPGHIKERERASIEPSHIERKLSYGKPSPVS